MLEETWLYLRMGEKFPAGMSVKLTAAPSSRPLLSLAWGGRGMVDLDIRN